MFKIERLLPNNRAFIECTLDAAHIDDLVEIDCGNVSITAVVETKTLGGMVVRLP